MREEDIDFGDIPEISEVDVTSAVAWPPLIASNSVAVYSDIYEWFAVYDRTYLRTINMLLRRYMEARSVAALKMPA